MRLAVRSNVDQVFKDIDAFIDQIETMAVPRVLNELADQAQTAGFRKINEIYKVPASKMKKYASVKPASASQRDQIRAEITVKGNGFPLSLFRPRKTAIGVQVTIRGRSIVVPHAFLARVGTGEEPHTGVFARGAYGGKSNKYALKLTGVSFGRFRFARGERVKRANRWGSTELPINELFTLAPPDAFSDPDVVDAMNDRIEEQAPSVMRREIAAVKRGF